MKRFIAIFSAAAAAGLVTAAFAQEAGSPPPTGWTTQCASTSRGPRPDCSAAQQIVMSQTQQLVASITVTVQGETLKPTILLRIPIGLFIPAGLKLDVDGAEVMSLELQTCDQTGCYASSLLSDALVNAFRRGETLGLVFQNLNRDTIRIPVPLAGFSAAFERIR